MPASSRRCCEQCHGVRLGHGERGAVHRGAGLVHKVGLGAITRAVFLFCTAMCDHSVSDSLCRNQWVLNRLKRLKAEAETFEEKPSNLRV
jgi:hypothetical protein